MREILNKIKDESLRGSKEHCIVFHKANTIEHERAKFEVCSYLIKNGCKVYTEVKFSKGRADILAIKNGRAYCVEILKSETEEKFKNKKYPFETIKLKAKDVLETDTWKDDVYFL